MFPAAAAVPPCTAPARPSTGETIFACAVACACLSLGGRPAPPANRWGGVRLPLRTAATELHRRAPNPSQCFALAPMPTKTFLSGILSLLRLPSHLVWWLASATLPSESRSEYLFALALARVTKAPLLAGSRPTLPRKPLLNPDPIAWPTRPKRIARQMAKLCRSQELFVYQPQSLCESKPQWLVSAFEAQRGAAQSSLQPPDRMARTSRQSQEG